MVADGMGGTRFGGEAAATVIHHLCGNLPEQADELLLRTVILNGIESGNRKLLADLPDSGTTLAVVEISGHTGSRTGFGPSASSISFASAKAAAKSFASIRLIISGLASSRAQRTLAQN